VIHASRIAQRAIFTTSVSSSHGNWTVGAHGQREKSSLRILELVHDRCRIGVNQARLYTVPPSVVHQVDILTPTPNLPEWGHNSGKRLKMVDFGNLTSWCEPIAVPCEQPFREYVRTNRIEQQPSDRSR